jgi:antitoxin component YwqK of YwqJK toxin-antitoxin module
MKYTTLKKVPAFAAAVLFLGIMAPGAAISEGNVESLKDYKYWDDGKVRGADIYDNNGRLRAKTFVRSDGSVEKLEKYDTYGNKVEMAYYDEKGRLRSGIDGWAATRWYYEGSRLVAEMSFDEDGNPLERRTYSESGRLTARFYRNADDLNPYKEASMASVLGDQGIPNVPFRLKDDK